MQAQAIVAQYPAKKVSNAMTELSTFRLYLMRAMYALIFLGMGSEIWPVIVHHTAPWGLSHGAAGSLLAGLSAMAALGIRYPVQMLPLLLFELVWKTIWLLAIALPLWLAGQMDANTWDAVTACLLGVVLCPIVIPWRYVVAHYVTMHGDRWRAAALRT
jgi:hypothetical protein